jgi:outer membrane immunogenic protein
MLKKFLLSTMLVATAGTALAADLPYRTAPPAPAYVQAMPMFTWTGFYVGLNVGGARSSNSSLTTTGLTAPNNLIFGGSDNNRNWNFTGGAQAGYNMQFGSIVAGVEGDINYLRRNRGSNGTFPTPVNSTGGFDDRTDFAVSRGNSSNYYATLRGRLGFAFDRALIYGTGGLAFGGRGGNSTITQRDTIENTTIDPVLGPIPNGTFTSTTRTLPSSGGNGSSIGYALGAGVEYAFTNSMSFKIEYMRVDLGRNNRTFTTLASAPGATMAAGNTIAVRGDNKFDVVRAGVNFRF